MPRDQLNPRLCILLELLPKHSWKVKPAAIAAGYSESYADRLSAHLKDNIRFCQAVAAKRTEIGAETQDEREKCLKVLDSIIDNEKAAARDRIRATEVRGRMCGWMSETRILETPERQRVLDESQAQAAQEIALLWGRLHTLRLPGDSQALPDETNEQNHTQ